MCYTEAKRKENMCTWVGDCEFNAPPLKQYQRDLSVDAGIKMLKDKFNGQDKRRS